MTVFFQPLHYDPNKSLDSQLLDLYEAYCEFQCYCAYVHHAHSNVVRDDFELNDDVLQGIFMNGQMLVNRSEEIKQQMDLLLERAQEEGRTVV